MKRITALGKALRVLSFYRWAFGDLTEADSDIGLLALCHYGANTSGAQSHKIHF